MSDLHLFPHDICTVKESVSRMHCQCEMMVIRAIEYIFKWTKYLSEFRGLKLNWIELKDEISWNQVNGTVTELINQKVPIDFNCEQLWNELPSVQLIVGANLNRWNQSSEEIRPMSCEERWFEIFESLPGLAAFPLLVELVFAISPSNATTERVFSKVKQYWTDSKSNLEIYMLKSAIITKCNMMHHNENCDEFVNLLAGRPDMLEAIQRCDKYDHKQNAKHANLLSVTSSVHDYVPVAVHSSPVAQSSSSKRSKSLPKPT